MNPDTCGCGKGKLKKGTTDFTVRVEGEIIVIRDVPAYDMEFTRDGDFWPGLEEAVYAGR